VLIALVLAPVVLALSKGVDWGWTSPATIGCFAVALAAGVAFVRVEQRAEAPLVDLHLLRNRVLVGATLAILIVAGTINALMYVLSLYFQNPATLDLNALETGLATLPAAAGMIAITPLITPLAAKIGGARAVALGFLLSAAGFAVLAFVESSWTYAAFVGPLIALAVGLGIANGPASSGSTAAVSDDQVGQASGISNMARYIGGSVAVAAVAMIFHSVINSHAEAGESEADALAAGLSAAALTMAIWCACGIALIVLLRRLHTRHHGRPADRAAAAASSLHTIPVPPPATAPEPAVHA
jgi:Na+/melibiose symporter-like transporter